MKQLKLSLSEKISLLNDGYIEIQRGIFTITITSEHWLLGGYVINVLNPYDTEKLAEEMSSLAIHLNVNK